MNSFKQTSSITRRLMTLALLLVSLFLIDFVGTHWASRELGRGLHRVHDVNLIFDLTSQVAESLGSASEALQSAPGSPSPEDVAAAFAISYRNALTRVNEAARRQASDEESSRLIESSHQALEQFGKAADEVFKDLRSGRPEAARMAREDLLVARQFELEARDPLRKLQLRLKSQSDQMFAEIHGRRNLPLVIGIALGILFLGVVTGLGIPIVRSLIRSINNLVNAADRVAQGELEHEAPILSQDELGKMTHSFNRMVASVAEKEREAERFHLAERMQLEFLARSAERMTASLDYEQTLAEVARVAVPFLADWCIVDVVELDGTIRRVAGEHMNPAMRPIISELARFAPKNVDDRGVVPLVLRTGSRRVVLAPENESVLAENARSPEHAALLMKLGFVSAMCVPIRLRDRTLGAISFFSGASHSYGERESLLADDLARRAATAIDNARLFRDTQAAVRLRDEFLSIASHELRTPLTPLKLQIQGMIRLFEKLDPETSGGSLERIGRALQMSDRMIERLRILIDDLLDLSRLSAGKLALRPDEFDLVEMAREVVARFSEEIRNAGSVAIVTARAPVTGRWDRTRLEQVLVNLITNAMRYGAGKPIEIEVSEGASQELAMIRVSDQGIGIAPEDQERIFGKFERASPSAHYGGLGIGLFITRQIVELHGGRIEVKSKIGQGSTFVVTIPRFTESASLPTSASRPDSHRNEKSAGTP